MEDIRMEDIKLFGMPAEKGRWLLIPLSVIVLLCLGTVYSWTIFRNPLEELLSINATQSLLPFTVLLVLFSLLMPITGFFINRFGTRILTALGGLVMGIGYILSGVNTSLQSLIITYGVIAGIGVGIAYGVPLAVIAKWFPDKKGIAVGLTVTGFGLSPLITAPIVAFLIKTYKVKHTFMILGIAFTAIILIIANFLDTPPQDWKPTGWTPKTSLVNNTSINTQESIFQYPGFYGLWLCYTIGSFSGLSAIGISSSLAREMIKLDKGTAAITVSLFAVFNALGRLFFGWFTDRFGPKLAAIVSFTMVLIASLIMLKTGEGAVLNYLVAFSLFYFSFGGWLAIAPTTTLILFSSADYAKNYGIVFTAYGAGALGGTLLAGRIRDIFGSYTVFFYPTTVLAILGIIVAVFMLKRSFSDTTISEV